MGHRLGFSSSSLCRGGAASSGYVHQYHLPGQLQFKQSYPSSSRRGCSAFPGPVVVVLDKATKLEIRRQGIGNGSDGEEVNFAFREQNYLFIPSDRRPADVAS